VCRNEGKDGKLVKVFVLFEVAAFRMMRGIVGLPLRIGAMNIRQCEDDAGSYLRRKNVNR